MLAGFREGNLPRRWESAHVCPQCGFLMALAELGLRGSTTGLVTCPKCDLSGPIEIRVINRELID